MKKLRKRQEKKEIGIVAHRAPQLALEVITKNITWEDAIKNDWHKNGEWDPGWEYEIDQKSSNVKVTQVKKYVIIFI